MVYLSTMILALFITLTLVPLFRRLAFKVRAVDMPNPRKVHALPMPKTGGLAMATGALVPLVLWLPHSTLVRPLLLSAGVIVFFGFLDDLLDLDYKIKFGAQLLAALVVVLYGKVRIVSLGALLPADWMLPFWMSFLLTVVVIVGVTNAINLADGLDGLAGGIGLMAFAGLAFLGYRCNDSEISLLAMSACGAILGFLRYNTHPATIFMGDAGSQLMGFMAIVLALKMGGDRQILNAFIPLFILGMPVLDTLYVMLDRCYHGRSPFVADKNHLHHRLLRLGFYHSEAVFIIYVLQALLVTFAIKFCFYSEWLLLAVYGGFVILIIGFFYLASRRSWKINRGGFVDREIKVGLRRFKNRRLVIVAAFKTLQVLFPAVLICASFMPPVIPFWLAWMAAGLATLILLTHLLPWLWKPGVTIRTAVYLLVPPLIFLGNSQPPSGRLLTMSHISMVLYGLLVFVVMLVLKYTRRQGFQSSPLDFLILFIALLVPNLPDPRLAHLRMGVVAGLVVIIFYSYEVWVEESRQLYRYPALAVLAMLVIVILRGFMGNFF